MRLFISSLSAQSDTPTPPLEIPTGILLTEVIPIDEGVFTFPGTFPMTFEEP